MYTSKQQTIYLDMDGVLADFNDAARKFLGASLIEERAAAQRGRWLPEHWEIIKSDERFYRYLPKTDLADPLVNLARQFRDVLNWNLRILTAIPKNNDMPRAFQDKVEWVISYYPDIPVYFGPFSRDKARFAQPGDILVDDRQDNCNDWLQAGGKPIKVNDQDRSTALEELNRIYLELIK